MKKLIVITMIMFAGFAVYSQNAKEFYNTGNDKFDKGK